MSILTRKRPAEVETVTVRARLAPMAKNASPVARKAGRKAKDSADSVMTWAAPHIDTAREWAAPHVERTGLAVRDSLAPRVSDLLVDAAHRLEKAPPRRRRWPKALAMMALLGAAASAAAALAMRRRSEQMDFEAASPEAPDAHRPAASHTDGDQAETEPEANGQHRMA